MVYKWYAQIIVNGQPHWLCNGYGPRLECGRFGALNGLIASQPSRILLLDIKVCQ